MCAAAITLKSIDLSSLSKNPTPTQRADIAGKVSACFASGNLSEREYSLALDILQALLRDTEVRVRAAAASHLAKAGNVPRDVLLHVASDTSIVAKDVLRHSLRLTEEDLIAIVRASKEVEKLVAIAQRDSIPSRLSAALLDTHVDEALSALLANHGAKIEEKDLIAHWNYLSARMPLLGVLVQRGGLPVSIAERVYAAVSDEMKQTLSKNYNLSQKRVDEAVDSAREWAMLAMLRPAEGQPCSPYEVQAFVAHLHLHQRLNDSIILRSLCLGDVSFFEAALARRAGIPEVNLPALLGNKSGFSEIYKKAKLPLEFMEAARIMLSMNLALVRGAEEPLDDYQKRLLASITEKGYDRSIDHMAYLLSMIGEKHGPRTTLH